MSQKFAFQFLCWKYYENTIAIAESQQYRLSKSKWQCELLWIALCWQKIRKIKHWKYYGFENPWVFKFLVCKTLDIFLSDENIIWHHLHLQDFPFSFPSRCDIINMHISLWDPFFFLMNEQWYELTFFEHFTMLLWVACLQFANQMLWLVTSIEWWVI